MYCVIRSAVISFGSCLSGVFFSYLLLLQSLNSYLFIYYLRIEYSFSSALHPLSISSTTPNIYFSAGINPIYACEMVNACVAGSFPAVSFYVC